jgi:hypothetical protein
MGMIVSKVLGTVRLPDGRARGRVDGLVVRENGLLVVITLDEAWLLASQGLLRGTVPGSSGEAPLEATGQRGPEAGIRLTAPDGRDDLLDLPIWDRERACWVNPLRPSGPTLYGPSLGL